MKVVIRDDTPNMSILKDGECVFTVEYDMGPECFIDVLEALGIKVEWEDEREA